MGNKTSDVCLASISDVHDFSFNTGKKNMVHNPLGFASLGREKKKNDPEIWNVMDSV